MVTQVELEGVYFSPEKFDIAEKAISEKIAALKKKLATEWNVPEDTDFSSTTKLGQLFKQMGWPEIEQSKAGNYKTSDPVLTEYERLGMPGIKTLKELRSYNVAMGTFINGWRQWMRPHEDGTYRIHPNCNTFGTSSFRHAMNDPNFQQIPSGSVIAPLIKKLFTTPEKDSHDWLIVDADFRSLQMILAFADCGLNDKGIDQIAYDIYGPKGNQDAHAVTAYNTFCAPTHLQIIEIEDESGNKNFFGEEQKIVIKGRAIDQEEQIILGREFQEHDEFIKYA
jgi:DNA polymerase I-like protein with 3'-5' exonuclease and polymerase domains